MVRSFPRTLGTKYSPKPCSACQGWGGCYRIYRGFVGDDVGIMEKKMETTTLGFKVEGLGYIGVISIFGVEGVLWGGVLKILMN